jgi:uncharacterized protein involved in cysteine biosynthesis
MLKDFLNFDRYMTPAIIRIFYYLQVALICLFALSGIGTSLATLFYSFFSGLVLLCGTLLGTAIGIIGARIVTEIVMVVFQNNEHLAVLRARAEGP